MLQRIGRYDILERIAGGGQGTVYRARETMLLLWSKRLHRILRVIDRRETLLRADGVVPEGLGVCVNATLGLSEPTDHFFMAVLIVEDQVLSASHVFPGNRHRQTLPSFENIGRRVTTSTSPHRSERSHRFHIYEITFPLIPILACGNGPLDSPNP